MPSPLSQIYLEPLWSSSALSHLEKAVRAISSGFQHRQKGSSCSWDHVLSPQPHGIRVAYNRNRGLPDWQWHRNGHLPHPVGARQGTAAACWARLASQSMDDCPKISAWHLAASRLHLQALEQSTIIAAHCLIILSTELENFKFTEELSLFPSLLLPAPDSRVSWSFTWVAGGFRRSNGNRNRCSWISITFVLCKNKKVIKEDEVLWVTHVFCFCFCFFTFHLITWLSKR